MALDSPLLQQFFILYFEIRSGPQKDIIPSEFSRNFAFHQHMLAAKITVEFYLLL